MPGRIQPEDRKSLLREEDRTLKVKLGFIAELTGEPAPGQPGERWPESFETVVGTTDEFLRDKADRGQSPRLELTVEGQAVVVTLTSMEDFSPDNLLSRTTLKNAQDHPWKADLDRRRRHAVLKQELEGDREFRAELQRMLDEHRSTRAEARS